jgi:hypothetical protein
MHSEAQNEPCCSDSACTKTSDPCDG